jgi:fluoride exporter
MSVPVWIGVAALGSLGALGRVVLEDVVSARAATAFPMGTLAVNVSGAFVLGLLTGLTVTGTGLVLAGGAAIGSYTTFSTWMLETHGLSEDGRKSAAAVNVVASVACGIGAAALGRAIGVWL